MYDAILLPTDGSAIAERAASHGLYIARIHDAAVHIVYVINMGLRNQISLSESTHDQQQREGEAATQRIAQVAEHVGVTWHSGVLSGTPSIDILQYADEADIDLITIGTHGRTGVRRYLLGSVTVQVVREAPCPVMTVSYENEPEKLSPALIEQLQYDRVLLTTDGSEGAQPAVTHALSLAQQCDATVHALYVVNELAYTTHPPPKRTWEELKTLLEQRGHDIIQEVQRTAAPNVRVVEAIQTGLPHDVIRTYAEENNIDCIAMGTHGRQRIKRVLLGSVAERTVRTATVPVLTAREQLDTTDG